MPVSPLRWTDGLELLDQRELPKRVRWLRVRGATHAARLIRDLAVRGAPAIGLVAAYAMAAEACRDAQISHLRRAAARLVAARPTAVNLAWAVARVMESVERTPESDRAGAALAVARALHDEDAAACRAIGSHGARLFPGGRVRILTHCNAGALATGGIGTALGVVRVLSEEKRLEMLYAREARPVLQGARLTAWEAMEDDLPVTLLADSAAGTLLARGAVDGVVVGADRIAADGSVANKIGTYPLAVLARRHAVPFVVAAPVSTFDLACADGAAIPIEERAADEVRRLWRCAIAPGGVPVFNPAFDVTPPELISAIVSERGVASPVNRGSVARISA
jgi:methylthioribose-1-phosphate isomerase